MAGSKKTKPLAPAIPLDTGGIIIERNVSCIPRYFRGTGRIIGSFNEQSFNLTPGNGSWAAARMVGPLFSQKVCIQDKGQGLS